MNQITFQTNVASKALRCRVAGGRTFELVEFGMRRAQGLEPAAYLATRASAIGGFQATSDVKPRGGSALLPAGTMAHSYIESFPSEITAFRAFAQDFPEHATFLIDTFDTLEGVDHAIEAIEALGLDTGVGVRLDSGDLASLAGATRRVLDDAGHPEVSIFVSGGLDEHDIAALMAAEGAPVNAVGVGTRLGVSADVPYLDTAYKLVSYEGRPAAKLSPGKETYPGAKQVFRAGGLVDYLGLAEESGPRAPIAS